MNVFVCLRDVEKFHSLYSMSTFQNINHFKLLRTFKKYIYIHVSIYLSIYLSI